MKRSLKAKSKRDAQTQLEANLLLEIRSDIRSALDTVVVILRRTNAVLFAGVVLILLLVVSYITVQFAGRNAAGGSQQSARHVTFLAVNDIYRLEGVAEGKSGGLSRVRTLRRWIERDAPNAILLHAGDFLSPSLVGREFDGKSMIDIMNSLDGDPNGFDHRMFVTFGNHEFDDSKCDQANPPLNARVAESQFMWLAGNLDYAKCRSMSDMLDRKNVRRNGIVIDVDNVKVGIFGIGQTPDQKGEPTDPYPTNEKAIPAARRSIAYLRERGAEVIVALTHLSRAEDEELIKEFTGAGLDLLVGGHDHTNMVLLDDQGKARGFKADSDARTAWRIDVQIPQGGKPRVEARLITLNEAIPPDINVARLAKTWSVAAEKKICARRAIKKAEPYNEECLAERVGYTRSVLELEENANRMRETGFGDWLADLVAKETGADVAIINSGILGLNEDLAPGTGLLMRHVVDIFRFDDVVAVESFPARTVCKTIAHGFKTPGMGAWPHVSGVEVELKPSQGNYDAAVKSFRGGDKSIACDGDKLVKVAAVPYILCSNDGYEFLPNSKTCIEGLKKKSLAEGNKKLLSDLAEAAIRAAGNAGINLPKDGRLQFIDVK